MLSSFCSVCSYEQYIVKLNLSALLPSAYSFANRLCMTKSRSSSDFACELLYTSQDVELHRDFPKNTHWPQAALKNYKVRYVQNMAGRPQTQICHSTLKLLSSRIPQICYFPISSYFIHLFFSHKIHSNHNFSSIHSSQFPLPSLSP